MDEQTLECWVVSKFGGVSSIRTEEHAAELAPKNPDAIYFFASLEVESSEPTNEVMEWLVRNGCFSADSVAIGFQGTPAAKTRAVIHRALEGLIANGCIHVPAPADWNEFYVPDPPYNLEDIFGKQ